MSLLRDTIMKKKLSQISLAIYDDDKQMHELLQEYMKTHNKMQQPAIKELIIIGALAAKEGFVIKTKLIVNKEK